MNKMKVEAEWFPHDRVNPNRLGEHIGSLLSNPDFKVDIVKSDKTKLWFTALYNSEKNNALSVQFKIAQSFSTPASFSFWNVD